MPELPEVETVVQGLLPHLKNSIIDTVIVRSPKLRWPIPDLQCLAAQKKIINIYRRGKYILIQLNSGNIIIHLGMSGRLCLLDKHKPPEKHDHVDIIFANNRVLRYTDPRRFGVVLWTDDCPLNHQLIKNLGPEPLTNDFNANYLLSQSQNKRVAMKPFIMDSKIVVGVGNIYATESLFLSGIHPMLPAGKLDLNQAEKLVLAIKKVLLLAIKQGGTTLKDFVNSSGNPGYFSQKLQVYGRAGLPCVICDKILQFCRLGQRSTVFCSSCQNG